ncbi:MAG: sigma-70 family RNA polymerase sigma factor [Magnetococcales bacterium]|nr:sigma-70 family RNA polymerase sigma factor [Magnetococcales bacterium]
MKSGNSFHGIDGNAVRAIRFKARQLSFLPCFSRSEVEDLEQEMVIDVLHRLPHFDPSRASLPTFLNRIVGHCAATLIARQKTKSLGDKAEMLSLDDLESGIEQVMTVIPLGMDHIDLSVDVNRLLVRLPNEHRRICHHIMFWDQPFRSCRLGMSRTTFYRRLDEIRAFFSKAGLKKSACSVGRFSKNAGM